MSTRNSSTNIRRTKTSRQKNPIRLAILSRDKSLHSTRRLIQEARKAGVECYVVNPLDCQMIVEKKNNRMMVGAHELPFRFDAILPRIGTSITDFGLAVVKHFELLDMTVVNGSQAILESRDKMRSLQILARAGLKVPATVMCRTSKGLKAALAAVGGMPVVLKVLRGTQGVGVMLLHTPASLESVLDTLRGLDQDVILQQFLAEGAGRDYRVFVVGGQVVAAMMRTAAPGEFRSNIHRGGEGKLIKLPKGFERAAVEAARILKLGVAGVDLMESNQGPMILEVNSSPGFEGIEKATGLNIAGQIMRYMVGEARKARRRKRAR